MVWQFFNYNYVKKYANSGLFFFIFVFSIQLIVNKFIKFRRWLDSNRRSLVSEATGSTNWVTTTAQYNYVNQCDLKASFFFQYLAICSNTYVPNSIKNLLIWLKICQLLNELSKLPKDFFTFGQVAKFCKIQLRSNEGVVLLGKI